MYKCVTPLPGLSTVKCMIKCRQQTISIIDDNITRYSWNSLDFPGNLFSCRLNFLQDYQKESQELSQSPAPTTQWQMSPPEPPLQLCNVQSPPRAGPEPARNALLPVNPTNGAENVWKCANSFWLLSNPCRLLSNYCPTIVQLFLPIVWLFLPIFWPFPTLSDYCPIESDIGI